MTGSAKLSISPLRKYGLLRRVAPRNDDKSRHTFTTSRRDRARVVHESLAQENRGRGECRVPAAPAASCAKCWWHTSVATTGPPGSPGIPARNGFNGLCRALPGDRALLPPSSADMACQNPVGPTCLRELDASVGASGPHDFAVRSNRLSSARFVIAHGPLRTRPAIPSRAKRCRVHRIPPRVRDDRDTPLCGVGWRGL
jgi:hypothetical protein